MKISDPHDEVAGDLLATFLRSSSLVDPTLQPCLCADSTFLTGIARKPQIFEGLD